MTRSLAASMDLSCALARDAWDFEARRPTRAPGALVTLMVIFAAVILMVIFAAVTLMGIFSPGTPSRP